MVRSFRSCQDKENRVAADRRGGSKIIRPDPDRAGKSGPPGDESPLRGQDRPPPGRGIGIPEAVRKRQRGDEPLQQEQSTVDRRVGGQQRWARLVEQHRDKRPASGLLQKLQRSGWTSGCPLDGVLGPGADHQRNQLKSMFERKKTKDDASLVRLRCYLDQFSTARLIFMEQVNY